MQAFALDTRELLEDRVPSIKDLGHTDAATVNDIYALHFDLKHYDLDFNFRRFILTTH